MNIPFIDLKTQYEALKPQIQARVNTVFEHGQYIMGPEVRELEERLEEFVGVKHAIGVSSGTDALLIALMALEIGPGDEVITTPFSFFSTAEAITLLGARPVFVDIDPLTYNIDSHQIEASITTKTRAIMPVSLFGQCADIDKINEIADKYGLPVIEDGAQSFGATYKGRKSCGLTTIGCTSFFPSKPLGGYGDSGACFTDDAALAKKIREIRVHGQDRRYHHNCLGINGRMDTLQAAILLPKLEIFPKEVRLRQEAAQRYNEALLKKIETPYIATNQTSVYAQYTIQVDDRETIRNALDVAGIATAVHYQTPLNKQPALRSITTNNALKTTERLCRRVLCLPIDAYISPATQSLICDTLTSALTR